MVLEVLPEPRQGRSNLAREVSFRRGVRPISPQSLGPGLSPHPPSPPLPRAGEGGAGVSRAPEGRKDVSAPEGRKDVSAPEGRRDVSAPEGREDVSALGIARGRGSRVPITFLLTLALLAPTVALAQSLPFRTYSSDEGLAESVVLALYQDSTGYLWFGTPNGASRFDGLTFETFDTASGLPNDVVRAFYQHSSGELWVATDGGLAQLEGNRWRPHDLGAGLDETGMRCLTEDPAGNLWVGTWGAGLLRIAPDGTDQRFTSLSDGLAHDRVRACWADADGTLWFGTFGGGVSHWTGSGFVNYGSAEGLGSLAVRALARGPSGALLVGTSAGLYRFDPTLGDDAGGGFQPFVEGEAIPVDPSPANWTITSLLADRQGRLWLGTRDRGACRWDGAELRCFRHRQGLADNSLNALLEDSEGNLWFGTFGGGASRLSSEGFLNYTTRDGLPHANVQSFAAAGETLWLGTHGGGLVRMGHDGPRVFDTRDGVPHDKVVSLGIGADGELLVGTLEGIARSVGGAVDADRFEPWLSNDALSHPTVLDVRTAADDRVWLGTLDGFLRGRDTDLEHFTERAGLPRGRINHVHFGRDGGTWFATEGGLMHYDEERLRFWTRADGLADDYVNWVLERDDGLWIATASGLNQLTGDPFGDWQLRTWGPGDGLSHDKCTVLVEDEQNRLWVGTTRGIHVLDGDRFVGFTGREGLVSSEVNPGAALRDPRGRLWFGTVRGAVVFEPDAALRHVPPPRLVLTGLRAGERDLLVADGARVDLPSHERDLRFDYAGISLSYPEAVEYEIALQGHDARPRRTRSRSIEYAALAPGDYQLRVRARHGQEWSEPAVLSFSIATPFYQTPAFRFLAVLALLGLAGSGHAFRLRAIESRNQKLASEVAERTAELRHERQKVRRKNEVLETTNLIVQSINAEVELDDLLRAILEGACFLSAADCALALVRERGGERLEVAIEVHWPGAPHNPPPVERAVVEAALLAGATNLGAGICYGEGQGRSLPETFGRCPQSYAVMTAEVESDLAGYLVVGKTRDFFDEEQLEALERLHAHVVSAFAKGRSMDALQRLNRTKDEFLGMAAHDLRSPLGGLKSYTELLTRLIEEDRLDKTLGRRFFGNMRSTVEQMLSLVEKLLDVTAIEIGRIEIHPAPFSLADLVREQLPLHERTAAEKSISLAVELDEPLVLEGDRLRLAQVLDNLVTNAIKYTEPGGSVRVRATEDEGTVVLEVVDTGQGLFPEELQHLFTGRKLSARPTAEETSTGLGLVIVKRLVDLHGGSLEVTSTKDEGSTFRVRLPRG